MLPSLKQMKDPELLAATQRLVREERAVATLVLRHLQEIEVRKLYADLKYGSLFEYAVHGLGYSEGAAHRRIQAMRLLREIPEVAEKIESGALNLSNISQAQSFFREQTRAEPARAFGTEEKKQVLAQLEQKSAREGQRILLAIGGPAALPRERERIITPTHSEVSFVLSDDLKRQLTEVRALLGPKGALFSLAELVAEMARLSCERLTEKRFGKRRAREAALAAKSTAARHDSTVTATPTANAHSDFAVVAKPAPDAHGDLAVGAVATPDAYSDSRAAPRDSDVGNVLRTRNRHVSTSVKHDVWQRARGQCENCGSQHQLNYDHIQPFALGGDSDPGNIQLLCQSCNIRRGVKTFGPQALHRGGHGP
jgi:hypothetical protein